MKALLDFASAHGTILWLAFTAAIITMPPPGTRWNLGELYRWFYDWAHQFPNLKNARPTLPAETPGNPKP